MILPRRTLGQTTAISEQFLLSVWVYAKGMTAPEASVANQTQDLEGGLAGTEPQTATKTPAPVLLQRLKAAMMTSLQLMHPDM